MKHYIRQFFQREAHPVIQFMKYGIAGVTASAVDIGIFYFLSFTVFKALGADDILVQLLGIDVEPISLDLRSKNFVINSIIAFLFSNFTAYIINIYWVFEPGRHKRHVEIALFYLASIVAITLGTFTGWVLIEYFALDTTYSFIAKAIAALLVNFACRKFLIFKG